MNKRSTTNKVTQVILLLFAVLQPIIWWGIYESFGGWEKYKHSALELGCFFSCIGCIIATVYLRWWIVDEGN